MYVIVVVRMNGVVKIDEFDFLVGDMLELVVGKFENELGVI